MHSASERIDTGRRLTHYLVQLRYNKAWEFVAYHPQWAAFARDLAHKHDEMCDHLQEVSPASDTRRHHTTRHCLSRDGPPLPPLAS
jgi:hypothetical protein